MKAIIHIGTQKTGTTTIQSFLALNRAALSSQGLRVQPMSPRLFAQMELALAGVVRAGDTLDSPGKQRAMGVRGTASQRAYVARVESMLRRGAAEWPEATYLASSEQIHAWCHNRPRIEALHGFLGSIFDSVRYVVYYRPQDEFLLSTWSESIRRGELKTLDQHIDGMLEPANFNRRAQMWASVVGREDLSVRLFDRPLLVNRDLLEDFCAEVGIDRAPLQTPADRNPSLSAEEVALAFRLGRYLSPYLPGGTPNPAYALLSRLMARRLPRPGTRLALTDAQRQRIRSACAASNEAMRARFFPDRATLFAESWELPQAPQPRQAAPRPRPLPGA